MNTLRTIVAVVVTLLLAACGQGQNEAQAPAAPQAKTVAFYKAHEAERKAKLADCHERAVNTLQDTADAAECRAAGRAAQDVFLTVADNTGTPKVYKRF